jgi:hypothetical protein
MVGIYQIDVQLPSGFQESKGTLSCVVGARPDHWEQGTLPLDIGSQSFTKSTSGVMVP